ncbi:MAG: histidinol dehydrogenase, partial [Mycobacterium sp.]
MSTTSAPVMPRIDLRGVELTAARLRTALPRGGADAALEFGASFDGVRPAAVRVPEAALKAALADLDPDVVDALRVMIERARAVHADQRRTDVTTTLGPGATVTERWVPVER